MAIPFILGGLALASAVLGAGAHISASDKRKEAKELYEDSNEKQHDVGERLEQTNRDTTKASENLGLLKLQIQDKEIAKFLNLYKMLEGKVNKKELNLENLEFNFTPEEIKSMKKISMSASEVLGGGVASLTSGALAGAGIYGSVMTLGAASTGTAIASLSGVAATNATLAWLGGGSLAAGGGGMALGTTVLGGLVAGPAILVSGWFADEKAEKALTEAKEFEAKVDIACERMESDIAKGQAIEVRIAEFDYVINKLRSSLNSQLLKLENIVDELTVGSSLSDNQKKTIHITFSLAKTLKSILELNILDKQGKLTKESENVKQKLIVAGI